MTAIADGFDLKAVPISACDERRRLACQTSQCPSARGEDVASPSRRAREDARLFERYRRTGSQDAREELVRRFLPLAKRVAARYRNGHDYDDLVQVASFALVKAIDRYDPDRGLAFSSFAVPTIVGELKRYFRDHTWAVRVPGTSRISRWKVQRGVQRSWRRASGRSPTPAEIAEELDSSVELVLEALQTPASAHVPRQP